MAAVVDPTFTIRPMHEADLAGVLAVERGGYPYPWSQRIFEDCLRVGYCCLVADSGGRIDGHGIMMARAGEAHILNICVDPGMRRSGIASALLAQLLEVAVTANADCAFLEVRPSNHGAIALYQGAGFHEVGRRPGYYPAAFGREDALVMARGLDAPDE
ncbi:MAG: ribosomal protein S18-alanine N-acetyltransferase [Halofilum sp. (in: g-proteobacteria)]